MQFFPPYPSPIRLHYGFTTTLSPLPLSRQSSRIFFVPLSRGNRSDDDDEGRDEDENKNEEKDEASGRMDGRVNYTEMEEE